VILATLQNVTPQHKSRARNYGGWLVPSSNVKTRDHTLLTYRLHTTPGRHVAVSFLQIWGPVLI